MSRHIVYNFPLAYKLFFVMAPILSDSRFHALYLHDHASPFAGQPLKLLTNHRRACGSLCFRLSQPAASAHRTQPRAAHTSARNRTAPVANQEWQAPLLAVHHPHEKQKPPQPG